MNIADERKLKELPDSLTSKEDVLLIMRATIERYEEKNLPADAILWGKLMEEIDRLWV